MRFQSCHILGLQVPVRGDVLLSERFVQPVVGATRPAGTVGQGAAMHSLSFLLNPFRAELFRQIAMPRCTFLYNRMALSQGCDKFGHGSVTPTLARRLHDRTRLLHAKQ